MIQVAYTKVGEHHCTFTMLSLILTRVYIHGKTNKQVLQKTEVQYFTISQPATGNSISIKNNNLMVHLSFKAFEKSSYYFCLSVIQHFTLITNSVHRKLQKLHKFNRNYVGRGAGLSIISLFQQGASTVPTYKYSASSQ